MNQSPKDLFRESLELFIDALDKYRAAHELTCESKLADDYVLGDEWASVAKGLLGLLNGELGGLDRGTLDRTIRDITKQAGFLIELDQ